MSVSFAVVQGAAPTTATTQAFVAPVGFGTPKAAILTLTRGTANGTIATDMMMCVGFTDGTTSHSVLGHSRDTVATVDADRSQQQGEILHTLSNVGVLDGAATFDSFSDRTLTIDWSGNPPPSAYLVTATLISGTDVEASVGVTNLGAGPDNIAHGLSAAPDLMFFLATTGSADGISTSLSHSMGLCVNDGSLTQRVISIFEANGGNPSSAANSFYDTRAISSLTTTNVSRDFEVTDVDGTNVELTRGTGSFGADPIWLFVSFGSWSGNYELKSFDSATTATTQAVTNTGSWEPQFIMLGQSSNTAVGYSNTVEPSSNLGFIDANDEFAIGNSVEDGVTNGTKISVSDNKAMYSLQVGLTADTAAIGTIHTGSGSIDSGGFTIDWTTNNLSTAIKGWALMVEKEEYVTGFTVHIDASDADNLYETSGNPPSTAPSDGDSVQQWDDEATTDNWTYGNQPIYRATGLNSIGCLEFDGTNDHLSFYENTVSTKLDLDDMLNADGYTVIIAFSLESDAGAPAANVYDNEALIAEGGSYWGLMISSSGGTDTLHGYHYDTGVLEPSVTIPSQNAAHVVQFRLASGTLGISIDGGTEDTETSVGDLGSVAGLVNLAENWGGSAYLNCKIGEMFVYDSGLAASNDTYTYMQNKWLPAAGGSTPHNPFGLALSGPFGGPL